MTINEVETHLLNYFKGLARTQSPDVIQAYHPDMTQVYNEHPDLNKDRIKALAMDAGLKVVDSNEELKKLPFGQTETYIILEGVQEIEEKAEKEMASENMALLNTLKKALQSVSGLRIQDVSSTASGVQADLLYKESSGNVRHYTMTLKKKYEVTPDLPEAVEEIDEVTTTANVATYPVPIGMIRRKKKNESIEEAKKKFDPKSINVIKTEGEIGCFETGTKKSAVGVTLEFRRNQKSEGDSEETINDDIYYIDNMTLSARKTGEIKLPTLTYFDAYVVVNGKETKVEGEIDLSAFRNDMEDRGMEGYVGDTQYFANFNMSLVKEDKNCLSESPADGKVVQFIVNIEVDEVVSRTKAVSGTLEFRRNSFSDEDPEVQLDLEVEDEINLIKDLLIKPTRSGIVRIRKFKYFDSFLVIDGEEIPVDGKIDLTDFYPQMKIVGEVGNVEEPKWDAKFRLSTATESVDVIKEEAEENIVPAKAIVKAVEKSVKKVSEKYSEPEFRINNPDVILPDNNEDYGMEWDGNFGTISGKLSSEVRKGDKVSMSFRDEDGNRAGEIVLDTATMKVSISYEDQIKEEAEPEAAPEVAVEKPKVSAMDHYFAHHVVKKGKDAEGVEAQLRIAIMSGHDEYIDDLAISMNAKRNDLQDLAKRLIRYARRNPKFNTSLKESSFCKFKVGKILNENVSEADADVKGRLKAKMQNAVDSLSLPKFLWLKSSGSKPDKYEKMKVETNFRVAGDLSYMAKKDVRSHKSYKNSGVDVVVKWASDEDGGQNGKMAGKVYSTIRVKPEDIESTLKAKFKEMCEKYDLVENIQSVS